jgi:hypothetical protein
MVPGQLFELRARPPMQAADALENASGVLEVSLFGTALHVALADDVADPEGLARACLAGTDVELQSLRSVRPTLEHAFLALADDDEEGSE